MEKIQSLFKRDYEGNRQVYDEVVEGSEWVLLGEGYATEKYDGTACMIKSGVLYKRYDAKVSKSAKKRVKREGGLFQRFEFKSPADDWVAAQDEPDYTTGHWPGWLPISMTTPEDKWHREAISGDDLRGLRDGTYELVGEKVQSNPYDLTGHDLYWHDDELITVNNQSTPRTFDEIKQWLLEHEMEGIVWHHPDGRMVKIKCRDFGLEWPVKS